MKYLAMLLLAMACRSTPIISLPIPGMLGASVCAGNNQPVVILSPEVAGTKDEAHVLIHEMTHVRFMRAHKGGCKAAMLQYTTDKHFRVLMELAAYCAEGVYLVKKFEIPKEQVNLTVQRQFQLLYDTVGVSCDSS